MKRKNIVLLSDFGNRDVYVGVMKGVIADIAPEANVIDLCHEIEPQNISQAAYLLAISEKYFPVGSIFVAVVDPGVGSGRKAIAVKIGENYFVGPDNGILSLVLQYGKFRKARAIENSKFILSSAGSTFHGRDKFAPAAAHIAAGINIRRLGPIVHGRDLIIIDDIIPKSEDSNHIRGKILHVDRFGNLISNIFHAPKRTFQSLRVGEFEIERLRNTFSDVKLGETLVYAGSFGFLEIAVRNGDAAKTLGVRAGDAVVAEYLD